MKVRHIIFDLGNVVVDIHPERAMKAFAAACQKDYEFIRQFFLSPLHLEFMRGMIPPTKFYHTLMEKYDCDIPYDEFIRIWDLVIGEPKPGIEEIVQTLVDKGYRLSLCSNTDPWHWKIAQQKCPFLEKFDHFFLSFELQIIKPDSRIFQFMLEKLNARAPECVLIDDTKENLDEASRMGYLTILADNSQTIREGLAKFNLI